MIVPEFDAFVAIDWSGAAKNYNGIAIAICRNGKTAPRLVHPRGKRWTRTEAAQWLNNLLTKGDRFLIGFDFAFGFPFESECGYQGGQARDVDDIFGLWSLIEHKSGDAADFGCHSFVNDSDYSPLFWT